MISVIIPSKNNAATLDTCLKSVVDSLPLNKEIIVVDARSTDDTPLILAKYKDRIRVVYDEGKGVGNARNVGARNSTHEIIAFVDADVTCARDHFLKILDFFNAHSSVAALDTDGTDFHVGTHLQRMESIVSKAAEEHFSRKAHLRGWATAFRKTAFEKVGGFWHDGAEDTELNYRLRLEGFKFGSIKDESVHVRRTNLIDFLKEMHVWGRHSAYVYCKYSSSPIMIDDFKRIRLFAVIPNVRAIVLLAYLLAPLTGVKYLAKTGRMDVYMHFLIRQYATLFGYVQGNTDIAFHSQRVPWQDMI
jgi:glycosyltransferase involved in cell wall biosynthesis